MTDSNKARRENVFEILDNMMLHLNRTKHLFLLMILTVLILPPISMLVMVQVFDPPFEGKQFRSEYLREELGLPERTLTDEQKQLIKEKFDRAKPPFKAPQIIITVISLVWLGIGIRQWFVISKWSKRYKKFKEQQDEIDKKLEDDNSED